MPTQQDNDALKLNNDARSHHNLHPLKWDEGLAKDAHAYAQKLADANEFKHSGVQGQGENLYMSSGNATLSDAVKAWLSEEKNYHGEKIPDGNFASYGHYTQCLWSSTTNTGIGLAKSKSGGTYIVGRYTPPGNYVGQKPY